jgi:hypothetical protein
MLSSPRLWLPAALLLLPTLVLQLSVPHLLRSRLAPSLWTVVVGGVAIVWLTQVATVAAWGLVDTMRRHAPALVGFCLIVGVRVGTAVTAGLAAGLVPGLWLQARLAFAPLDKEGPAPPMAPLLSLAVAACALALLGQSLAAGLAEAAGTIVPIGDVDGRSQFALRTTPHVMTSLLAYALSVAAVTMQAVGVSRCRDGLAATVAQAPVATPVWVRSRGAAWSAAAIVAAGACAAAYKLHQHLP